MAVFCPYTNSKVTYLSCIECEEKNCEDKDREEDTEQKDEQ